MADIFMKRFTLKHEGKPIDCLVPISEHDHELLIKLPKDKSVKAKVTRPRSNQQHRLYWGLCREVLENIDHQDFQTEKNISDYILLRIGQLGLAAMLHGVRPRVWPRPREGTCPMQAYERRGMQAGR